MSDSSVLPPVKSMALPPVKSMDLPPVNSTRELSLQKSCQVESIMFDHFILFEGTGIPPLTEQENAQFM